MSKTEMNRTLSYAIFNKNGFIINYPGVHEFWVFLGEKVGWGHFTKPEQAIDPDALQLTEVSASSRPISSAFAYSTLRDSLERL